MQPYQPNQPSLLSPTLSQAIQAARSWVAENAADKPGCLGAYIGGSAPTLSPEDRLEPLYDLAARIGHTPLPYSTDISPLSRFTAIQASRTLIAEGAHREITFWTLTTYARAMKVLLTDAPDGYRQYLPCFEQALQSVGRLEQPAVQQAVTDALAFLPRLRQLTDRLINLPAE